MPPGSSTIAAPMPGDQVHRDLRHACLSRTNPKCTKGPRERPHQGRPAPGPWPGRHPRIARGMTLQGPGLVAGQLAKDLLPARHAAPRSSASHLTQRTPHPMRWGDTPARSPRTAIVAVRSGPAPACCRRPDMPDGGTLRDSQGRIVDDAYAEAAAEEALVTVRRRGRPRLRRSAQRSGWMDQKSAALPLSWRPQARAADARHRPEAYPHSRQPLLSLATRRGRSVPVVKGDDWTAVRGCRVSTAFTASASLMAGCWVVRTNQGARLQAAAPIRPC